MKFQHTLLWIACLFFIVYGLGFTLLPQSLAILITNAAPQSSSGLIDMRATYGGMSIAVGLIFGLMLREPTTVRLGVISIILMMAGMAGGRLIGIVIDGNPNWVMYLYLGLEILVIILSLVSLRSEG